MSIALRYLARCGAYSITMLLAAVWTVGGLESLTRPLFDLGKPLIGDAIILIARALAIPSESIVLFALMLVGLKFMVGAFLLAALFSAAYEKIHFGSSDDAMLDVALLTSAIATVASALPGLTARRRIAAVGDRRTDAVRDRERARDLRPRLPGEGGTAASDPQRAGRHSGPVGRALLCTPSFRRATSAAESRARGRRSRAAARHWRDAPRRARSGSRAGCGCG